MVVIILHQHYLGKNYLKNIRESIWIDTFDGAKPRFLNRGKKRRSVSTLSPSALLGALSLSKGIPRALVLSAVEGSDRGVEWVDFLDRALNIMIGKTISKNKRGIIMKLLAVLVICLMLPVLAFSQEKIDLKLMTGPMGGSWYPLGGAIAELIQKSIPGTNVSVAPGGGVANVVGVQDAKA